MAFMLKKAAEAKAFSGGCVAATTAFLFRRHDLRFSRGPL